MSAVPVSAPSETAPLNLLSLWAELLVASLADAGVECLVASPGSRNTPFLLAASREPRLRVVDVIDERAAGFYALGMARASGAPVALLCTSGSAAAHYLPAVLEADLSGIPLVLLTADRPFELIGVGANQAFDQPPLFGPYVRRAFDPGAPDAAPSALRGLRRLVAQAVAAARAPHAGPVHINLRARKPLEPLAAASPAEHALAAQVAALRAEPLTELISAAPQLDATVAGRLATLFRSARRGLIVAGPAPIEQAKARGAIGELLAASGFALMAEAASQLRCTGGALPALGLMDWLFRLPMANSDCQPDFIVQIGAPPTSGAWESFIARHPGIPRLVIAPEGWPDPQGSARWIVQADVAQACARLAAARADRPDAAALAANQAYAARLASVEAGIRELLVEPAGWDETNIAPIVMAALPPGAALMLGNSLPIRLADAYGPARCPDLRVLCQRGLSGIDGQVAGAAGSAAAMGAPVLLWLGDVSLQHDLGGLLLAGQVRSPLVVLVVNNGGGRIFEQLPVARATSAEEMHHFTTPIGLEWEQAARLARIAYARADDGKQLAAALDAALTLPGATLLEVVVPPSGAAERQQAVMARLRERFAAPA